MNRRDNACLSQEEMVDLAVGKLPQKERIRKEQHLAHCPECRRQVEGWRKLLYALPVKENPPKRLKRRLFLSFLRNGVYRKTSALFARLFRFPVRHRREVLFSFLFFALIGGGVLLTQLRPSFLPFVGSVGQEEPNMMTPQFVKAQNPSGSLVRFDSPQDGLSGRTNYSLVWDPWTEKYDVISVADDKVYGHLWRNDRTRELLIIMEEILHTEQADFQVWLKERQSALNLGLLMKEKRGGHLYYHGDYSGDSEILTISLEPKGGSPFPTGPEPYVVYFK